MDADFSIRRFSLVDRGWIYAIAHVRGGSEMGFGWFLDGRRFTKKNTFTDFIAVAEDLIAAGYGARGPYRRRGPLGRRHADGRDQQHAAGPLGRRDRRRAVRRCAQHHERHLAAADAAGMARMGQSARETRRPTTTSRPTAPTRTSSAKAYPAVLSTGGLTDPRVTYWEPAKWVAKLRPHTTSGRPILLKMNMGAGHAGSAGRFEFLRELAHDYAFAIKAIGSEEGTASRRGEGPFPRNAPLRLALPPSPFGLRRTSRARQLPAWRGAVRMARRLLPRRSP